MPSGHAVRDAGAEGGWGELSARVVYPVAIPRTTATNRARTSTYYQRIRRIDPHGVITTVAAGLEYTQSLVFAGGGIYFTEQSDESPAPQSTGRVSALNLSDGNVTVLVTSTTPIRTLG